MGKGGALNAWIKEFCALVFTQTLQAFIYAMIIVLILATTEFANSSSADDQFINNTSMGIINIFALTSVFKIEDLARKIFGIQKSEAQPQSPMASMAKLAFMSHFGRRLWDNGKKIVKGGTGIAKGYRDKRKNRRKYLESSNRRDKQITKLQKNITDMESGIDLGAGAGAGAGVGAGAGAGARAKGGKGLTVSSLYINAGHVNMEGGGSNNGTDSDKLDKMKDRLNSLLDARDAASEAYDDKMSVASKQIQDSVHMLTSGIAETTGAVLGGSLGAVIGSADGKGVTQATMAGMAMGDTVGKTVTDIAFAAKDLVVDVKKDLKSRGKLKGLELESTDYTELIEAIRENQKLDEENVKSVIRQIKADTARKRSRSNFDTDTEVNNM